MAAHSSVPAWRIPGAGEPGGLPSMGSHRVGHDRRDLATAAAVLYFGEGNSSLLQCSCLENPRDGEPGGLHRIGHNRRDAAAAAAGGGRLSIIPWCVTTGVYRLLPLEIHT